MKAILDRAKKFKLTKRYRDILLLVGVLLILDVLIALLAGSYLSHNVGTFLRKSDALILSDLLFFEGAAVFIIGSFVAFGRSTLEIRRYPRKSAETSTDAKVSSSSDKRIHRDIIMILIGALLLGLSLILGALFG